MADKLRTTQQLEALQNKYVGTGHADTTRFEWTSNIQRDSLASYVGHPPLLSYMTLAMGEGTREEMRVKLIEKMVRPVGPPPEVCSYLFYSRWLATDFVTDERPGVICDRTLEQQGSAPQIHHIAGCLYQHPAPLL
ncbi:hypothetical protein D6D23_07001 [Aureobasidium pullulans]|nr:hypothetical protein D6D23_07001 [Aureobasidium pullulans]